MSNYTPVFSYSLGRQQMSGLDTEAKKASKHFGKTLLLLAASPPSTLEATLHPG